MPFRSGVFLRGIFSQPGTGSENYEKKKLKLKNNSRMQEIEKLSVARTKVAHRVQQTGTPRVLKNYLQKKNFGSTTKSLNPKEDKVNERLK